MPYPVNAHVSSSCCYLSFSAYSTHFKYRQSWPQHLISTFWLHQQERVNLYA